MQKHFKLIDQFGLPLEQLAQMLSLPNEELGKYRHPGLVVNPKAPLPGTPAGPKDDPTAKNDLAELIIIARSLNSNLRIAIKADKGAEYKNIDDIIETLRKTNSNRFNLITSARGAPE